MKVPLLFLALLLSGCATPERTVAPIHRDSIPLRPGDPGTPQKIWNGYFTDWEGDWIATSPELDTCSIVSDWDGKRFPFHLYSRGVGLTSVNDSASVLAVYRNNVFYVDFYRVDLDRDEDHALTRATRIGP